MDEKITKTLALTKERGNQFLDGDFRSRRSWLSEKDYSRAVDSIVIACVDIIVICKGKIVLGKRITDPWPSYWIIGGRMFPGETFEKAAQRNMKRELGLKVNSSRFFYFDTYNFVWSKRQPKPKNHGSHYVSIAMIIEISEKEFEKIEFDRAEYGTIERWMPEKIMQIKNIHPAIKKIAKEVIEFLLQKSMKQELNF